MFKPTFDSLYEYEAPDWFVDGKFGIWAHWGPQSVPMCGDWYARHLYVQDSPQNLYHVRHYGHPSKFGYKDIAKLWKAENFDPDGLLELYKKAGAKYFVGQAMHHDHYFNYGSKYNRFNSTQFGPMKDICKMWKDAADKQGLPFGLTEHLGATFSWWNVNKLSDSHGPYKGVPYDGNDPEYRDIYLDNYEHVDGNRTGIDMWYTANKKYHEYWLNVFKEFVDIFSPDLVYSDGALPFGKHWHNATEFNHPGDPEYDIGLEAVAYLYNNSVNKNGRNNAVYLQKDQRPEIYRVGIRDVEKSQLSGINEDLWHTDTCIGNWFYDAKQEFKKPGHIIEMLIDIVSKNGVMLLNILQKPGGEIDDETRFILDELAGWIKVCGEGIYGTRPYKTFGEGPSRVLIDGFKEVRTEWACDDYRFTKKGNTIYAFMMGQKPGNTAVLYSFKDTRVNSVSILGGGNLNFIRFGDLLNVELPKDFPVNHTNCLKIEIS